MERELIEGASIKLGRQVKSNEPSTAVSPSNAVGLPSPADASPNLGAPNRPSIGEEGGTTPVSATPRDTVVGVNGLPPLPKKTVENVWFKSKVVSRCHAELWLRDGQVYLKDAGSSSGTFLNRLRLSPSNKMSRPYPLRDGDVIQLGIDYQGRPEDIYKSVIIKISISSNSTHFHLRKKENPARFRTALKSLLNANNPYASSSNPTTSTPPANSAVDCCICLCVISPYQALFLSPCSHCYHYKCIRNLLSETHMFQCPMCRQVANLDASVSMESLVDASMEADLNNNGEEEEEDDVREVLDVGARGAGEQWEMEMNALGNNFRGTRLAAEGREANVDDAVGGGMGVSGIKEGGSLQPLQNRNAEEEEGDLSVGNLAGPSHGDKGQSEGESRAGRQNVNASGDNSEGDETDLTDGIRI
ncbi:hypothetical protein HDV05_006982 [Chytridiales sp. JEL 0842]|nr:hypothetical protein HDV05_006982 [Chytridiales sp. JEL 0842]